MNDVEVDQWQPAPLRRVEWCITGVRPSND
jgi:hypothetical protein